MNPYASIYLLTVDQHRRDLANEYRWAQTPKRTRRPDNTEYKPVDRQRLTNALRKLRRRQSPQTAMSQHADARARRVRAA